MKTSYLVMLFIVVAGIQIFVPTKMILDREHVLNTGKAYKFKTQPIDPNDPFRGKYIVLNYDEDHFNTHNDSWKRNETIYLIIGEDSLGFADVKAVSKLKPESDMDYIKTALFNALHSGLDLHAVCKAIEFAESGKSFDEAITFLTE